MVVDVVVRYWVMVMVEVPEEQGERVKEGRHQADLFYADDGMVASLDPRWIQGAFNTLAVLFYRLGLRTNSVRTFGVVCRPCQAVGTQLEAAYWQRITG